MIGKIMSEAAHSIIGMLSAKPADMETRPANNEFSSLLLSSETRPRPGLDKAAAGVKDQGLKDHSTKNGGEGNVEDFLNQLIGNSDLPVAPVSEPKTAKTVGIKLPVEINETESETGLPADMPLPLGTIAENARFIPAAVPSSNEDGGTGDTPLPRTGLATGQKTEAALDLPKAASDLPKRNSDHARPVVDVETAPKLPARAEASTVSVTADKQPSPLPIAPTSNAVPLTQTSSAAPASKDTKRAAFTAAQPVDVETIRASAPIGKAPAVTATLQEAGSQPRVRDLLDRGSASKGKAEPSAPQPGVESKSPDAAITASKPVKPETRLPVADMDSLPTAGHLEKTVETSAPAPVTPVPAAQNATTKTVGFDWNAPQFAERFASELADLKINGDLKKFEINPRNMGRLEVSFIARGASEIVRIEAESAAVREMIVQHSQAIQDLLKANGRSDLTVRVDVRDNMLAGSGNSGLNPGQQDSAGTNAETNHSAGEGGNGPRPSQGSADAIADENYGVPQGSSDNSRYA